jgi:hypothetical protein
MPVFTTRSAPFSAKLPPCFPWSEKLQWSALPYAGSNVTAIAMNYSVILSYFSKGFSLMIAVMSRNNSVSMTDCMPIIQDLNQDQILLSTIPDTYVCPLTERIQLSIEIKSLNFRKEASDCSRHYRSNLLFRIHGLISR